MDHPDPASELYRQQGFGLRMGFGKRAAVLIVDMQNDFTDAAAQTNASRSSQEAIPHILRLREVARDLGVPVFYSRGIVHPSRIDEGLWQEKSAGHRDGKVQIDGTWGAEICDELRPAAGEVVINKHKPSVFYGSDFDVYMRSLKVDTLVICGSSTSGCVRATATDAFMREIRPILPRECQVDRDPEVMAANLFDLDSKYADVVPLEEVIDQLGLLAEKRREAQTA